MKRNLLLKNLNTNVQYISIKNHKDPDDGSGKFNLKPLNKKHQQLINKNYADTNISHCKNSLQ